MEKNKKNSIAILIPAYNEQEGIESALNNIKDKLKKHPEIIEVIVIDDGSSDKTGEIASKFADKVITHKRNKGYGAAIKTGVRNTDAEYVLIMDSDGQHNPDDIEKLLEHYEEYEMVVGARTTDSQLLAHRQPGKKILSTVANILSNYEIPDLNSGFRIIKKSIIEEFIHILPNGFSLSTTISIAALKAGYDVKYVPITTKARVGRKSSVKFFRDGFNTLMLIIRVIVLFDPLRFFIPASILLFLTGVFYSIFIMILKMELNIPSGALLTILTSVLIFFFGIISDQISMMRRDKE